jgi:arylformamidase
MPIYDISLPVSESMTAWPGDPSVRITQPSHLEKGDVATVSRLEMGVHGGTHVDAPVHFIPGAPGIDSLDLDILVGPVLVVHALGYAALTAEALGTLPIPPGTRRVLFRTRNSDLWARNERQFDEGFVAISEDGAHWLVERGLGLVGVDYLSIAPFNDVVPTHQILLGAGVIPVEGLDLSQVSPGIYQLVCLPLKILGGDGAPARVILVD